MVETTPNSEPFQTSRQNDMENHPPTQNLKNKGGGS